MNIYRRIFSAENIVYGHENILNQYCNDDAYYSIKGILQHGWNFDNGISYINERSRFLRKFVWNKRDILLNQSNTFAMGAPWLYMSPDHGQYYENINLEGYVLGLPYHSTRTLKDPGVSREVIADQWLAEFGNSLVICLHPRDYFDVEVFEIFTSRGMRVVTAGANSRLMHQDPEFLFNFRKMILGADEVVSNEITTGLLYAANLNVPTRLFGSHILNQNLEARSSRAMLTSTKSLHEKKLWADEILGIESKLGKEELANLLGLGSNSGITASATFLWARAHDIYLLNKNASTLRDLKLY
jgi:hypothetical protein